MRRKLERWEQRPPTQQTTNLPGGDRKGVDLRGVDSRKIARAREILGSVSAVEAVEVALDLLVLDDAHSRER